MAASEDGYQILLLPPKVSPALGLMTDYTSYLLARLGKKPLLSYIIESYPAKTGGVIVTDRFADHVRQLVSLAYPERDITVLEIDQTSGSGLGEPCLWRRIKDSLPGSFIIHFSDYINTVGCVPVLDHNWLVKSSPLALVGIFDHERFWRLWAASPPSVRPDFASRLARLKPENMSWPQKQLLRVKDQASLTRVRHKIADRFEILDKASESLFIFDDFVIKFFADGEIARQRVERAKILQGLTPQVQASRDNFYRYQYVDGDLYSRVVTPPDFRRFLTWAARNLWRERREVEADVFVQKYCYRFYKQKTEERVKALLAKLQLKDTTTVINGEKVPPVKEMLSRINFMALAKTKQYQIHGDLVLDNIIKTKSGYCLLDWRQNFGGLLRAGDRYYDLAKLNHNLIFSHDLFKQGHFTLEVKKNGVRVDILRSHNLFACQQELRRFIISNQLSWRRINILTPLIWLNSSPLHDSPLDSFFFYFGKLQLWRTLRQRSLTPSLTSMAFSQPASLSTPREVNLLRSSAPTTLTE